MCSQLAVALLKVFVVAYLFFANKWNKFTGFFYNASRADEQDTFCVVEKEVDTALLGNGCYTTLNQSRADLSGLSIDTCSLWSMVCERVQCLSLIKKNMV